MIQFNDSLTMQFKELTQNVNNGIVLILNSKLKTRLNSRSIVRINVSLVSVLQQGLGKVFYVGGAVGGWGRVGLVNFCV